MKVAVLFSGGKDSTYATFIAKHRDEVACLVTMQPERPDSYMFHHPAIAWTRLQAEAMNLPQVTKRTSGQKEVEMEDLVAAVELAKDNFSIEGLYTGAIASEYQKSRIDRVCSELGLKSLSPLWGVDQVAHLSNLLKDRFSIIVTGVAALGLDERWLGRELDASSIKELIELSTTHHFNAALEGGEGETLVVDCPLFSKKLVIVSSRAHWFGDSGHLEVTDAKLEQK